MIDSGCTAHVTHTKSDFIFYHDFPRPGIASLAGKGNTIPILGHGRVVLQVKVKNATRILTLSNVLYIPQAASRFFAPDVALQQGHTIHMDKQYLTLHQEDTSVPLFRAERKPDRLYWLDADIMTEPGPPDHEVLSTKSTDDQYDLWHRRFGHAGKDTLVNLPGHVKGTSDIIVAPSSCSPCDGCEFGKSKCAPFLPSDTRAEHPLNLIHMDLVEYPSLSIDSFRYLLTTLDDHSSFGLMWFLKQKSDAFVAFKMYIAWAENQLDRKLKAIRSDRGGEFFSDEFDLYLAEKGIERNQSVARTPQQNGRAEHWQQTINYMAEAMRHHAGLTPGFWKLANKAAIHIANRRPVRRLK